MIENVRLEGDPRLSHDLLRRRIRALPPGLRLLDLGAAGGHLGRAVRDRCAFLAGVELDAARAGVGARRATMTGARPTRWLRRLEGALRRRRLRRRPRASARPRGSSDAGSGAGCATAGRCSFRFPTSPTSRSGWRCCSDASRTPSAASSTGRICVSTRPHGLGGCRGCRVRRSRTVEATAMPYELALPGLGARPAGAPDPRPGPRLRAPLADAVRLPVRVRGGDAVTRDRVARSCPLTTRRAGSRAASAGSARWVPRGRAAGSGR